MATSEAERAALRMHPPVLKPEFEVALRAFDLAKYPEWGGFLDALESRMKGITYEAIHANGGVISADVLRGRAQEAEFLLKILQNCRERARELTEAAHAKQVRLNQQKADLGRVQQPTF